MAAQEYGAGQFWGQVKNQKQEKKPTMIEILEGPHAIVLGIELLDEGQLIVFLTETMRVHRDLY